MADPLSLLRRYKTGSLEIIERDNQIIFGESAWPKDVKTMFRCKNKDGTKEYYTLECLLYFLKNYDMPHPEYVNQAAAANIQAVRRPDRKNVLQYLFGEIETCASIDQSTSLETPTQLKRTRSQEDGESKRKKPRVEGTPVQNVKRKRNKKKKKKT